MRTLLFILLIIVVWYSFKRGGWLRGKTPPSSVPQVKKIVRCQHCNIHFEQHEAIYYQDKAFCCAEHLELYQQQLQSKK